MLPRFTYARKNRMLAPITRITTIGTNTGKKIIFSMLQSPPHNFTKYEVDVPNTIFMNNLQLFNRIINIDKDVKVECLRHLIYNKF